MEYCRKRMGKGKQVKNGGRARLGKVGELLIKKRLYFILSKRRKITSWHHQVYPAYVLVSGLFPCLTLGFQIMLTTQPSDMT